VVVESKGEELDREDHLRPGEVKSPAKPIGVCSVASVRRARNASKRCVTCRCGRPA
jgi:hypothetical protein